MEKNNNTATDIDKDFRYAFSFYMSGIRFFSECRSYLEINEKEIDVIVKIRACSDMRLSLYWQKVYFWGEVYKTFICLIYFWMQIVLYITITQTVQEWTQTAVVAGSSSTTHIISTSLFGSLRLNYLNYISFFMIFFSLEDFQNFQSCIKVELKHCSILIRSAP